MRTTNEKVISKRTKFYTKDLVKVANSMLRPNIWQLTHKTDPVDGLEKRYYQYGNTRVIIQGQLFEKDFSTWLCMLAISEANNYQPFESDNLPVEIAKQKGVKNPYSENILTPIRDSIDRLFDSQIRIRPGIGKGLTAKFVLVQGWLESDGCHGSFSITPYRDIVQTLMFGQTTISKSKYLSYKSLIARALYKFLASQQPFYSGRGYQISLSLLCKHLNYDSQDKPWSYVWKSSIKNAIEELKEKEFIGQYKYKNNRRKEDGGILTFYPVKKALKPLSTGEANNEHIETIRKAFPDKIQWNQKSEEKFRIALNKAETYLEQFKEKLKYFLSRYCSWLEDQNMKYIDPVLFDPDNTFFQRYLKFAKEDGRIKAPYKSPNTLFVCHLIGHTFGKDYSTKSGCSECEDDYFKKWQMCQKLSHENKKTTVNKPIIKPMKKAVRTNNAKKSTFVPLEEKEEEMPITIHEKDTCYNGHKFGADTEKYDDCDTCEIWEDCTKAKKKLS